MASAKRQRVDRPDPRDVGEEGAEVEGELPEEQRRLLQWLRRSGATIDLLRFRRSSWGGTGAFASQQCPPGTVLATIPAACVLTADKAWASPLGVALREAAAEWGLTGLCSPEVVLWVYMIVGREDSKHPFFPYLKSLPGESPDPVTWPQQLQDELASTPAGPAIAEARAHVRQVHETFTARLGSHSRVAPFLAGGLPGGGSVELSEAGLLWARGMVLSRAFSPALMGGEASNTATADEARGLAKMGCLVPGLDLTNHKLNQPVSWESPPAASSASSADSETAPSPAHTCLDVSFRTLEGLEEGSEVFNNYGARPNEELLFSYGFTIRNNVNDAVLVSLVTGQEGQASQTQKHYVKRSSEGGVPLELLHALAQMSGATDDDDEDERGEASEKEHSGEAAEAGAIEIGAEEVELLLEALKRKLIPLLSSRGEDRRRLSHGQPGQAGQSQSPAAEAEDPRLLTISMYREGQREVLEDATRDLESLLAG